MTRTEWFKRKFPAIDDLGTFPPIIERLAGTPARLEELLSKSDPNLLISKPDGKWSIKEHIGHLSDLEPLWSGRVDDIVNGAAELTPADLTNQRTHAANHNATDIDILLRMFRSLRGPFVNKLFGLDDEALFNSSLHPRLKTPMRIIDLAFFVAEHDDHHLVSIREILVS